MAASKRWWRCPSTVIRAGAKGKTTVLLRVSTGARVGTVRGPAVWVNSAYPSSSGSLSTAQHHTPTHAFATVRPVAWRRPRGGAISAKWGRMALVPGMKVRYLPQPEWGVGHLVSLLDAGTKAQVLFPTREAPVLVSTKQQALVAQPLAVGDRVRTAKGRTGSVTAEVEGGRGLRRYVLA